MTQPERESLRNSRCPSGSLYHDFSWTRGYIGLHGIAALSALSLYKAWCTRCKLTIILIKDTNQNTIV